MDRMLSSVNEQGQYFATIGEVQMATDKLPPTYASPSGGIVQPVIPLETIDTRALILRASRDTQHHGRTFRDYMIVTQEGIKILQYQIDDQSILAAEGTNDIISNLFSGR